MTTAIAEEVRRRKGAGLRRRPRTFAEDLGAALLERAVEAGATATDRPDLSVEERAHYREEPVAFSNEVLGVTLWARQVEILEAIRDHRDIAVRGGRKIGKDFALAVAAIWFYSCFDDARVLMTAVTARQVDGILWREVRRLVRGAKRPIDGELHGLARSGLKAVDLREIVGFTAREAEAVAGISGTSLLYIVDEASAVHDEIYEAIDGNRAGGGDARLVMISNPTKTVGRFFEAFHDHKEFYTTIHVSSLESPNVVEGREVVRGLASREWAERIGEEWGVDSAYYKIHVLGEFVRNEAGRLISLDVIEEAEARWFDEPDEGRLQIGVDPAGPGRGGDDSAFAVRRGKKILEVFALRGLSPEAHVAHVRGAIEKHRRAREPRPVVAIDAEGIVGDEVRKAFVAEVDAAKAGAEPFELLVVRSSKPARNGLENRPIELVRDDLWLQLSRWLGDGAIPTDSKLERELHCAEWDPSVTTRRQKVIGKDRMREVLGGRSPDRADAVALAVWEQASAFEESLPSAHEKDDDDLDEPAARGLDPYGAMNTWRAR